MDGVGVRVIVMRTQCALALYLAAIETLRLDQTHHKGPEFSKQRDEQEAPHPH